MGATSAPQTGHKSDSWTSFRVRVERRLAACPSRAKNVQAHEAHDRGQPGAQVVDVAGVGSAEPDPGLLHGVVRLGQGSEHPVGHGPQVGAVRLELK
jgi:hypothetical protein